MHFIITRVTAKRIKKYFKLKNDNENTKTENLWDAAKAVLKGNFIVI